MRVIEKVTVGKRGDGSLIRVDGQPNWFSLICVRGKQHEISTGTLALKLALDYLVSDYRVRRVKSFGSALSHIKPVRDHFGDWRAVDHQLPSDRGLHHQAPGAEEVERDHQSGAGAASAGHAFGT